MIRISVISIFREQPNVGFDAVYWIAFHALHGLQWHNCVGDCKIMGHGTSPDFDFLGF